MLYIQLPEQNSYVFFKVFFFCVAFFFFNFEVNYCFDIWWLQHNKLDTRAASTLALSYLILWSQPLQFYMSVWLGRASVCLTSLLCVCVLSESLGGGAAACAGRGEDAGLQQERSWQASLQEELHLQGEHTVHTGAWRQACYRHKIHLTGLQTHPSAAPSPGFQNYSQLSIFVK